LQCGQLPYIWKRSHVTPVYKNKGVASDITNFRPIALTCTLLQLFSLQADLAILHHLSGGILLSINWEVRLFLYSVLASLINLITSFQYDQADYNSIIHEMEGKNWSILFKNKTVNENYSNFLFILNETCDKHIPAKTVIIRPNE
jgi:ACR3 family arsenite efflux pump ArsB